MGAVPDAEATPLSPQPRSRRSAYLSALRVPLLLAFAFAVALAGYYLLYVTQVRNYLVGRNFRLLATMGDQIEGSLESNKRILGNIRRDRNKDQIAKEKTRASKFIPILRSAEIQERPATQASDKSAASGSRGRSVALQLVPRLSQSNWVIYDDGSAGTDASLFFRLPLDELLEPRLRSRARDGTFDVLLVTAPDGRVLFQTGDASVRIANIAQLTTSADPKSGERKFDALARSSGLTDIVVSGTGYKLFTQPCCGGVSEEEAGTPGWVLCGLTAQRRLMGASYSVPFPILAILVPMVLLAVLSWPFVKVSLIGETQRVRAYDVALVGICTVVGAALITVCALDLYGSSALQGRVDEQLEAFANQIREGVGREIDAASDQLDTLLGAVAANRLPSSPAVPDLAGLNSSVAKPYLAEHELKHYPFFESFSLIDTDGQQLRKMSVGSFVTRRISVVQRGYFTHWRTGKYPPPMLEPVQSRTTGLREAILSKPAGVAPFEVAALAIPLRTLIDPVVVPGFGFVIINDEGAVLFHSDPQHSLTENFFIESDSSRRLRALVAARHTEWLDVKYWADDHRAYVSPLKLASRSLTLVTLYDKNIARAVHVEWLVLVLVFLMFYSGIYIAGCIAVLIMRPDYRAPWLWPDPAGSRKYLDLLPALLLLVAAFLIGTATLAPADLLVAAWLLPFLGWAIAYLVLSGRSRWEELAWPVVLVACLLVPLLLLVSEASQPLWRGVLALLLAGSAAQAVVAVRRRERVGRSALAPRPNFSYVLAAAVLLILVAVVPSVAFFRVGYDMQMESLVKHGQLEVFEGRRDRAARDEEDLTAQLSRESAARLRSLRRPAADWGIYQSFFFSTRQASESDARACADDDGSATQEARTLTADRDALPEIMEEYLPFYSEGSVRLRELTHDKAADREWWWGHDGRELVFCPAGVEQEGLRSTVPTFFNGPLESGGLELRLVWLVLGSLAVLGVVIWLVRFVVYNVFVADVIEPLWTGSGAQRRETWGPNLFLVSSAAVGTRPPPTGYHQIDLAKAPEDAGRWLDEHAVAVRRASGAQNVLILHFEARLEDAAFNRNKLDLIEQIVKGLKRTAVVVSAVPPSAVIEQDIESTPRWADVLSLFTIVPVTAAHPAPAEPGPVPLLADWASAGWREIVWRMNALGFAHAARFLDSECDDPHVNRLWQEVLPYTWHPERPALEVAQLLAEVGERAETYYREIWEGCTPAEKLALHHIAEEGLLNRKMKPTVRRLMARGIIRRQPNFVLMNETFRRFVLAASSSAEVTVLENSSSNPWEAIRVPFLAALAASLAFLFVTQHDLFNTTLAVVTGVGTAIPAIMNMASMLGHRRGS